MTKKTALITGASSGIGKELAKIHASKGGDLVIVARNENRLKNLKQELKSQYNTNIYVLVKDLSTPNATKEIYETIKNKKIKIDYLINNAGFGGVGKFNNRDIAQDLSMINLNISALVSLTHYFLQDFLQNNSGKILNVSSTVGLIPAGPMQAVYFASKSFVNSFSNAITEELKNTNVTVTNLMPGATKTAFGETSGMIGTEIYKNPASAKLVAKKGYEAMINGEMNIIAGVSFKDKVSLKLMPLLPKKMVLKLINKMQQHKK